MKTIFALVFWLLLAGLCYGAGLVDPVNNTTLVLTGSAIDDKSPTVSDYVTIYIDGAKGTGQRVGLVRANLARPDVTGLHGFTFQLPANLKDGKPHTVFVYRGDIELLKPQPTFTFGAGGGTPAVTLSRTDIGFPDGQIDTISVNQMVEVKNTGTAQLAITSVAVTGSDFSVTAGTCKQVLDVAASCMVTAAFNPKTIGAKAETLILNTNAAGSPHQIKLHGIAVSGTSGPDQPNITTVLDVNKNSFLIRLNVDPSAWTSIKVFFNDDFKTIFSQGPDFSAAFNWPDGCGCGVALTGSAQLKNLGVKIKISPALYPGGFEIRLADQVIFTTVK